MANLETVSIVRVERNTSSVNGEMGWIVGVFADPLDARRAVWQEMRELIGQGQRVYGRRTEADWDVEVIAQAHDVVPAR